MVGTKDCAIDSVDFDFLGKTEAKGKNVKFTIFCPLFFVDNVRAKSLRLQ